MNNYRVAKSYEGFEFDVKKAYNNSKGNLVVDASTKCPRCGGSGIYASRVENGKIVPHPAYNGVCLQCNSTGIVRKEIRLYTDKEYETLERAKQKASDKRAEEREEKMKNEYAKKYAEWLSKHSFNEEGVTYVYALANSYDIKEQLKDAGFRFSGELLWHAAVVPAGYEESCVEISLSEVAEITAWGEGLYRPDVKQIVGDKIKAARPVEVSTSEWIGEEKERLYDINVTLISIRPMETRYGFTQLVCFETEEGNRIDWWTATNIDAGVGQQILLTGTVKKHDEYNGIKKTIMTRCKIKEAF